MSEPHLVALGCRISDRAEGPIRGVEALAPLLADRLGVGARRVGAGARAAETGWRDDLAAARGCLLEAGGQVEDALQAGGAPVLLASDCAVGLTTLPTVARLRPDARILWLDAHGDFCSPEITTTGFLGGMALSGACGVWDPGLEAGVVPAERVVLAGARDLETAERDLLERSAVTVIGASLETLVFVQNALDRAPVYVHLDLDVLDPGAFPSWLPAPDGLAADRLYDVLEAVAGECQVVGLEITDVEAPPDPLERRAALSTALRVLEPLLGAVSSRRAHALR